MLTYAQLCISEADVRQPDFLSHEARVGTVKLDEGGRSGIVLKVIDNAADEHSSQLLLI